MTTTKTEARFHEAMVDIYRRAKSEAGYNATRYLQMLSEHGGIATARILLNSTAVSDGYTELYQRKRLDLTVEKLVLDPEWDEIFSPTERAIARKRLEDYGYFKTS